MDDALIRRMIQVGTVTAVSGTKARVLFKGSGMTSGWLSICQDTGSWIPAINDTVLVVYPAIPNSDGYIVKKVT